MLKTAIALLAAALSAPLASQQVQEVPEHPPIVIRIAPGQGFRCPAPEGCFVFNEAGLIKALSEVAEHAVKQACPGSRRGTI